MNNLATSRIQASTFPRGKYDICRGQVCFGVIFIFRTLHRCCDLRQNLESLKALDDMVTKPEMGTWFELESGILGNITCREVAPRLGPRNFWATYRLQNEHPV